MKLTLDHTQRLNLHALLGAQRADVGSIRAIWAIQDRLALDAGQEKLIELKREIVNGTERTVWNPALSISPQDFEFSDVETAHQSRPPDLGLIHSQCRPPMAATTGRCAVLDRASRRSNTMKAPILIARYLPVVMGATAGGL